MLLHTLAKFRLAELFPDAEPDFLADVAGIGFRVDDGAGEPERALVMRAHDDTEGGLANRKVRTVTHRCIGP